MKSLTKIILLLAAGLCLVTAEDEVKRPNIVVVLADDMGWGDSGTYGHELIQTPNMDKLASQGMKFMQCYSASGVCSPSRSAILTGRTPYRNGVWAHLSGVQEAHLRDSEITYPELLKEVGYETAHVGKWHLVARNHFNDPKYPTPGDQGYDYWVYTHNNADPSHAQPENFYRMGEPVGKVKEYSAQFVAKEADMWLKEKRDKEKPFVLSVWLHEPHSPIATKKEFQDLYGDHKNKKYMGNISQLDNALGMIMKTLEDIGEVDNTLLFFTSDNGPVPGFGGTSGGLRSNKRADFEGGIRVPGIIRFPGKIKPGTVSNEPIIGTDVFATALELNGIEPPKDRTIDSASMLPAFKGEKIERKIPMFWRTHVSSAQDRVAMRVGDWKIIGNDDLTEFMLFEVAKDWQEKNDLAESHPEKLEEMKAQIIALWEDIKKEGPNEWWEAADKKKIQKKGGKHNY